MEPGGQRFLHADGGAAAADVAGEGEELFDVDHLQFLVAGDAGGLLEVHLLGAGNDADDEARAVAPQHEGFEEPIDGLAEQGGDVLGAEVVLVDLVGDEFVGYLQLVEQPCGVGFIDFHVSFC